MTVVQNTRISALIVIFFVILLGSRFAAQAENNTEWIVRAGVSLNNSAGKAIKEFKESYTGSTSGETAIGHYKANETGSAGLVVGGEVSIAFNKPIGHQGVYWGMELGLGSRGGFTKSCSWRHSADNEDPYYYNIGETVEKTSTLLWNVKYTPFLIGYKYSLTKDIKIDGHFGGYVSYDLFGGSTIKKDKSHREYGGYDSDSSEKDSYSLGDYDLDFDKKLDAGILVGVGGWWKRFNLDFTYQRGFMKMMGEKKYTSNIVISLGYSL